MDPFTIIRLGQSRQQEILEQAARDQDSGSFWLSIEEWGSVLISLLGKLIGTVKERVSAAEENHAYTCGEEETFASQP